MSAPSTGEVMEALKRLRFRAFHGWVSNPDLEQERQVLTLLEKYAPEMVQREAEERQPEERKVRVTFTAEEARVAAKGYRLGGPEDEYQAVRRFWDKLGAALKSLDPPEMPERADREDEG